MFLRRILPTVLILLGVLNTSWAQKMRVKAASFSPIIQLTPGPGTGLEFGSLLKGAENPNSILLADDNTAWIKITAPISSELEIVFDLPDVLTLDQSTIPAAIRIAYSNTATMSAITAKTAAIEVPGGFTTLRIPVKGANIGGPPPPPSSPLYANQPTADVYLFFFGSAGPAANDVVSGNYTGTLFLSVSLIN